MKKKPKLPMKRAFWLKNLFLIACLLLTAIPGFSQNKTVTGTVVDATGEALIGASVLQQGTSNGGGLSTQRHTHLAVGGFRVLAPKPYLHVSMYTAFH